jgi:SPP1 family predicted phage head-tail adaptor
MATPSGKRNRVIAIQTSTETVDDYGGTVKTWLTAATVWAAYRPLRGRDLVAAQAALNLTEGVFNIRYIAGLTGAMRLVHDSKCYDITAVIDIEDAHKEIDIMVKTGVSDISTEIIQGPGGGVLDISVVVDGGVY